MGNAVERGRVSLMGLGSCLYARPDAGVLASPPPDLAGRPVAVDEDQQDPGLIEALPTLDARTDLQPVNNASQDGALLGHAHAPPGSRQLALGVGQVSHDSETGNLIELSSGFADALLNGSAGAQHARHVDVVGRVGVSQLHQLRLISCQLRLNGLMLSLAL